MINKKVASEIAVGILLLIALIIGGVFWVKGKQLSKNNSEPLPAVNQQNTVEQPQQQAIENVITSEYKVVQVNNPQIKFSFEIPATWDAEIRNSKGVQMSDQEMRDFLSTGANKSDDESYSLYTLDFTKKEIDSMNHASLTNYFKKRSFPLASVSSNAVEYMENTSYQIDFNLSNFDIAKQLNTNDCSGKCATLETIYGRTSDGKQYSSENTISEKDAKCLVENQSISSYNASIFSYDHDILDGKPFSGATSGNGCTGGKTYYISLDSSKKLVLTIDKPTVSPDDKFENDFNHIIQTLKIDNVLDETSNLKTYTNAKYGFEFKYQSNLELNNKWDNLLTLGRYPNAEINFKSYKNITNYESNSDKKTSIEQLISSFKPFSEFKKINFNGYDAWVGYLTDFEDVNKSTGEKIIKNSYTLLMNHGGFFYVIDVSEWTNKVEEFSPSQAQQDILASFRFTK